MQRLSLDFRRTRPASPWIRWTLLTIAIAFAAELGVSYVGVREAVAQKEARLAKLQRPGSGGFRNVSPEEVNLARETIQRLAMPWDNLFNALESTPTDKVALLAIEPDAKSGTVVISGEGKDYAAALDYASQLGRAKTLSHVYLVKHEVRQTDPRQSVTFTISASWRQAK